MSDDPADAEKARQIDLLKRMRARSATTFDPEELKRLDKEIEELSREKIVEKARKTREKNASKPFRDQYYVSEICRLANFPQPTFTPAFAIIKIPLFAGTKGRIPRKRIQNLALIPPLTSEAFKSWCKPLRLRQAAAFINHHLGNSYHPADIWKFQQGRRPIPPTVRALVHRIKHPYNPDLPA